MMNDTQTAADQTYALHRTLVLVGMMGCGKTAIGRALSARLGVAFLDSDQAIEEAAQASISEIFARDGEAFFRKREGEVLTRLLTGEPGVLSTGGGAFLADANRAVIAEHGVAIWLDAPLSLLWERVRHKDTRPLLRTPDPRATLAEIFAARTPIYAQAQIRVPIDPAWSIEDTTQVVLDRLLQTPRILERT